MPPPALPWNAKTTAFGFGGVVLTKLQDDAGKRYMTDILWVFGIAKSLKFKILRVPGLQEGNFHVYESLIPICLKKKKNSH